MNLPMVKRMIRRLQAGRACELQSLAARSLVHCSARKARLPRAIFPDGAMDKIRAVSPWRNWEAEKASCLGAEVELGPTVSHVIENVDISGAFLYAKGASETVGYGSQSLFVRREQQWRRLERASLSTTFSGSHFFGCLLLDDFPLELLARETGNSISMVTKTFEHAADYRALLQLDPPPLVSNARVRQLTVYTEPAFNDHKISRLFELRARIKNGMEVSNPRSLPGIYIGRGSAGEPRMLENETDVERLLEGMGFNILDPSVLSAAEITRRSLDARIVVGVEGSQLSHAIFSMAEDGAFLVIQPPDRFALAYKEFADALGMRFAFVVGTRSGSGFSVSLAELQQTLDLLR